MITSILWLYFAVVLIVSAYLLARFPTVPMWQVGTIFACGHLAAIGAYLNARLSREEV